MSTPTTSYGTTTITGSTIPTQTACLNAPLNNTITNPGVNDSVFIKPVNNQTLGHLITCCKGAPIVLFQDGCAAYCAASTFKASVIIANCLQPNGTVLAGIGLIGQEGGDDVSGPSTTSTSSATTPTTSASTTSTTSPAPSSGAAVTKPSSSILVTMAAGAMALGWVLNGLA